MKSEKRKSEDIVESTKLNEPKKPKPHLSGSKSSSDSETKINTEAVTDILNGNHIIEENPPTNNLPISTPCSNNGDAVDDMRTDNLLTKSDDFSESVLNTIQRKSSDESDASHVEGLNENSIPIEASHQFEGA